MPVARQSYLSLFSVVGGGLWAGKGVGVSMGLVRGVDMVVMLLWCICCSREMGDMVGRKSAVLDFESGGQVGLRVWR